ncbi:MAG TPA: 16S rRNA (uracil(1498)-N(3))-methyltransferase [Pyrinomonadaceae bacterium]|jgi:16S rRNA (uracil1498-N3)-methyltransferase
MARRRFYATREAFDTEALSVTLTHEEARHLRDVLRLRRGDEAYVFDGEGREYRGVVEDFNRDGARVGSLEEVTPARPESPLRLTLAVALLKGEKLDLVMQKATELGVARIAPVVTKLADVRLRDGRDAAKRVARWERIALEAAKQCGRARLPEISTPADFGDVIDGGATEANEYRLMFSERGGAGLDEALKQMPAGSLAATALVGSEGGWADEELEQAAASGWHVVTLGGRVMRAETAAIVVAALLQHLFGDLR